jgi:hypothetical protein
MLGIPDVRIRNRPKGPINRIRIIYFTYIDNLRGNSNTVCIDRVPPWNVEGATILLSGKGWREDVTVIPVSILATAFRNGAAGLF